MKEKTSTFIKNIGEILKQKKTRKYISRGALGVLILVILFIAIPLFPNAPYSLRMVTSNSMRPTFNTGSLVVITPEKSYNTDEIITYQASQYEQDVVTHRIVEKTDEGFITKGDANDVADDRNVTKSMIFGKVVFSIPMAGYVVNFLQSTSGFALVVIIPLLLVIADEVKNILREKKVNKNNNE